MLRTTSPNQKMTILLNKIYPPKVVPATIDQNAPIVSTNTDIAMEIQIDLEMKMFEHVITINMKSKKRKRLKFVIMNVQDVEDAILKKKLHAKKSKCQMMKMMNIQCKEGEKRLDSVDCMEKLRKRFDIYFR
jgi:16S rRNA C1402 N4-methylase RsmH